MISTKLINAFKRIKRKIKPISPVPNPGNRDIYLLSFPKSGNTWLRYLIAYAVWPHLEEIDLKEMALYLPSVGLKHDFEVMKNPNAPCNTFTKRIIKDHSTYNRHSKKRIKKAIYLVRDGRDVIVSYWFFCNQRDQTNIPLDEFIRLSSLKNHSYGSWRKHVLEWINAPLENKIILRYEDIINDPEKSLLDVLNFCEICIPSKQISDAVNKASFKKMQEMELNKGFNLEQYKNINFVRNGKIGDWKQYFTNKECELFIKYHGDLISSLGYDWER